MTQPPGLDGPVGDMLRTANTNYRKAMQSIEYIEQSPLGRLMGREFVDALNTGNTFNKIAPEKVVQSITRLHPSEIGVVKKILAEQSPETWQAVKRRLIEDALEESMQTAPSAGAKTLAMQGNKFISGLVKKNVDVKRLESIYTAGELSELNQAFDAIRRWGDRTGYNFSGTGPMNQFLGWLKSAGVKTVATAGGEVMALRQVAKAMNDPTARRHIIEITRLPNLQVPRKAAAYLSAILGAKEVDEEYDRGTSSN